MTEKNEEYVPTLTEWDELVRLWARSRAVLSAALSPGVKARIAWTTKQFVEAHPGSVSSAIYAWLERNLKIGVESAPAADGVLAATRWHDEPTAVIRHVPRGAPRDPMQLSESPVARGPGRG